MTVGLEQFDSLVSLVQYFKDDNICKEFLVTQRWNDDDFVCPYCGQHHYFRRMITGCYHDVSDEHLQSYIDEACFRWNTRKMSESERFAIMFGKAIGKVMPNEKFKLCGAA